MIGKKLSERTVKVFYYVVACHDLVSDRPFYGRFHTETEIPKDNAQASEIVGAILESQGVVPDGEPILSLYQTEKEAIIGVYQMLKAHIGAVGAN